MGHGSTATGTMTHVTHLKSDPFDQFDPLTHDPSTYCSWFTSQCEIWRGRAKYHLDRFRFVGMDLWTLL